MPAHHLQTILSPGDRTDSAWVTGKQKDNPAFPTRRYVIKLPISFIMSIPYGIDPINNIP